MNPGSLDVDQQADLIVQRLLGVKPGEQVVIVCDPHSEMSVAYALAGAVETSGAEYTIMVMPTRPIDRNNELTAVIEKGLTAADCLIGLTGASGAPTYSAAVRALLNDKKLRSISMVMRNLENFTGGCALADYDALYAEGQQLAAFWRRAQRIGVKSPAGTDLRASIRGEDVIVECGYATEPGLEAAFPDGEVSQMPNEGVAEGVVVVDGPIAHFGLPDSPITLRVNRGRVTAVEGDSRQAAELRQILTTIINADNIAEIGIGLNPACRRNGHFQEEKKARGNVHIAIGDNVFYGGQTSSPVHIDMVLYSPTVQIDNCIVVSDGQVHVPR